MTNPRSRASQLAIDSVFDNIAADYGFPAVVLENPKFPHNVGAALRACSCFGAKSLWVTGNRISDAIALLDRLPREERMKGYRSVKLLNASYPLEWMNLCENVVPVCVELKEDAQPLTTYIHPENAVYVFGPEDGGVSKALRKECHEFVYIPSLHCLNLAAAVYVTLYDRVLKSGDILRLKEDRGYYGDIS